MTIPNLSYNCQELPDELEYLIEKHETDCWALEDVHCLKGQHDLETGAWWSIKYEVDDTEGYFSTWHTYLGLLRERFGEQTFLKRMLPDGSYEKWGVVNDQ